MPTESAQLHIVCSWVSPPQKDPQEALVIAVTTRAIFNLEKEHEIFLTKGKDAYVKHQQTNENNPLEQGTAFAFIQVEDTVVIQAYM